MGRINLFMKMNHEIHSSLYDVLPSNIRVFYIDMELSELLGILHIEELRFSQKKLYTYNVQDGDEFLIENKC